MREHNELGSNWFERNQTKSVLTYTLIIIAATWAFYKFTFEENKLSLYKAQIESKESEISQYKARIEFLEKENLKMEVILNEYEDWNSKSANPGLFYKTKFEETAILKEKYEKMLALNTLEDKLIEVGTPIKPTSKTTFPLNIKVTKANTYINDELGLVIAVNDINFLAESDLTISVGNKKNEIHEDIKTGKSFTYNRGSKKMNIIISEVQFIESWVKFHITEE